MDSSKYMYKLHITPFLPLSLSSTCSKTRPPSSVRLECLLLPDTRRPQHKVHLHEQVGEAAGPVGEEAVGEGPNEFLEGRRELVVVAPLVPNGTQEIFDAVELVPEVPA
eukprot:759724-Hanusia_phi.AAC.4